MRKQLDDIGVSRDQLSAGLHTSEVEGALGKVDEAERAIKQLESQLAEERRGAAHRERLSADAAVEHRKAVVSAVEELKAAAAEMDGGLGRVVTLETEAVNALQRQDAYRVRTARLLLLQAHRPTLAKCYRAWRSLTAHAAGGRLANGGAAFAIAALKNRSISAALSNGGVGGGVLASAGGNGLTSEYMKSTLDALEDEWATREATAEGRMEEVMEELRAAKALAAQAMRESDEQRQRLDRQAASLASEGEALRRSNYQAREAERKAEGELSQLRARVEKSATGGAVDAVKAGLDRAAAEHRVVELTAQLAAATEAHAAEAAVYRKAVTDAELRRMREHETVAAQTKRQSDAERHTADQAAFAVSAAQVEASKQVSAIEEAKREMSAQLTAEVEELRKHAEANATRASDLERSLERSTDLQQRTAVRLHEAEIAKEELRAEMRLLRGEGLGDLTGSRASAEAGGAAAGGGGGSRSGSAPPRPEMRRSASIERRTSAVDARGASRRTSRGPGSTRHGDGVGRHATPPRSTSGGPATPTRGGSTQSQAQHPPHHTPSRRASRER